MVSWFEWLILGAKSALRERFIAASNFMAKTVSQTRVYLNVIREFNWKEVWIQKQALQIWQYT